MTAESPLERLRALRDEYDADAQHEGYGGELWSTTAARLTPIIAAFEAESETTVEWGVEYDDGKVTNCGEHKWIAETLLQLGQREGQWPQLVGESPTHKSVRIVTRTVTTHRTEWSTSDE